MRKNHKYNKKQMYSKIEAWNQSGLSQQQYCKQENLSTSTFGYWLKKYRQEKSKTRYPEKECIKTFMPVEVTTSKNPSGRNKDHITITYPNGIQVCCPLKLE